MSKNKYKDMLDKIAKNNNIKNIAVYPKKLEEFIKNEDTAEYATFIKFKIKLKKYKSLDIDTTKLDVAKEAISGTLFSEGIEKVFRFEDTITTEKPPIEELILPIIPTSDSLSGNYEGVEGLARVRRAIEGKNGLGEAARHLVSSAVGKIGSVVSFVADFKAETAAIAEKFAGGGTFNPHEGMLFSGHNRRSFSLTYQFMKPESREEEMIYCDAIFDVFPEYLRREIYTGEKVTQLESKVRTDEKKAGKRIFTRVTTALEKYELHFSAGFNIDHMWFYSFSYADDEDENVYRTLQENMKIQIDELVLLSE